MATTIANLQNLATAWEVGEGSMPIVIDLLKNSRLLQTAAVAKASHGIKHKYRYFNELPTAVFREIGEGIVPQKLENNSAQIDLKELVFDLYDDYQAIKQYPGGKEGWFRDNAPAAMAGIANALARAVFYGYDATFGYAKAFKGLHQYAIDLSKRVAQKGGSSGSCTSIFGVRWDAFDGASLRFNNTALMEISDLTPNQPIPTVTNTTTNAQMNIFKWIISSYFALVIPSAKSLGVITQVSAAAAPTVDNMNALVDAIDAPTGEKAIYTSKLGRRMIATLKDAKYNALGTDTNYNSMLLTWAGVPIYVDENISEVETNVLD